VSPSTLVARRVPARGPFEEAWFIEGSLDAERAFWLRYTLSRTRSGQAQVAVWAAVVEGDLVQAAHASSPTPAGAPGADPADDSVLLHTPEARLTPSRATGQVGPLQWDLSLDARTAHDHVPPALARLGLTGRHYASPGLDLRVSGSLAIGDVSLSLHQVPACLGHIWGARATTRAWAWAHCAAFEHHPEARFEALSARIQAGPLTLPWATSAVVEVLDQRRTFTRTRTLFRARSKVGPRDWFLEAHEGESRLRARIRLPHESHVVRARLTHANGNVSRVRNSPLAVARVQLTDPELGDVRLISHRASLELATREERPGGFDPDLP